MAGGIQVTINGQAHLFPAPVVNFLGIEGGDGADTVVVDAGVTLGLFILGGFGNDRLSGDGGNDALLGGAGNDVLLALDGLVDTLDGQVGTDSTQFDAGIDLLTSVE